MEAAGRVRSIGEPVMGGCSGVKSSIVLQVHCVREKADMKDIISKIRSVFEDDAKVPTPHPLRFIVES